MLSSGLASVTFRKLSPARIIDLVVQGGLDGIEWGGDVHVPHGDLPQARQVRRMTLDAGLKVLSYGSYYRVGDDDPATFEPILRTAVELGAPTLRVWCGGRASADADDRYRGLAIGDSRRIASLSAASGVFVAYEYHSGTLTDTPSSARALLEEVAHDNLGTYWQVYGGAGQALHSLDTILPWLRNVHAYHTVEGERRLLAEGREDWPRYLRKVGSSGRDHAVMVEFVRDESPRIFLQDAETLRGWIRSFQVPQRDR